MQKQSSVYEKTMCAIVATNHFHCQKPNPKVLKYNSIHFEFHRTNNYTHFRFRGSTLPNAIVGSCKYQGQDFWQTRPSAEYWTLPPALQNTPHHRTSLRWNLTAFAHHEFSPLTANDWHVSLRLRLADSELTASPVTHPSLLHEAPLVVSSSNLIKAPDVSRVNACMCVHQESAWRVTDVTRLTK